MELTLLDAVAALLPANCDTFSHTMISQSIRFCHGDGVAAYQVGLKLQCVKVSPKKIHSIGFYYLRIDLFGSRQ